MNYKCPTCGASHYAIQYYVSTLVGYQRIFKDGEEITKDPNHHMMHCQCLNCGSYFVVEMNKEQADEQLMDVGDNIIYTFKAKGE